MASPSRRRGINAPWRLLIGAGSAHNANAGQSNEADAIRRQCRDGAFKTYATSYIFQRRARTFGARLNLITYIGFVVPMIIGFLVLSYGHFKSLATIIVVASAFGIVQAVASNPPVDLSLLRHEYEKLAIQDEGRQEQDYQQEVKESEKRMGMRAALRKYQQKCVACGKVPTTMNSTKCGVCGKFRYRVS